MEIHLVIAGAVMIFMLCVGLSSAFDWELERRIVGVCTAIWAVVAVYLFLFQWLPLREPSLYSLGAITLLSTAGYIVGQTIASLVRRDWLEDLVPRREEASSAKVAARAHRRRTAQVISFEAQRP